MALVQIDVPRNPINGGGVFIFVWAPLGAQPQVADFTDLDLYLTPLEGWDFCVGYF